MGPSLLPVDVQALVQQLLLDPIAELGRGRAAGEGARRALHIAELARPLLEFLRPAAAEPKDACSVSVPTELAARITSELEEKLASQRAAAENLRLLLDVLAPPAGANAKPAAAQAAAAVTAFSSRAAALPESVAATAREEAVAQYSLGAAKLQAGAWKEAAAAFSMAAEEGIPPAFPTYQLGLVKLFAPAGNGSPRDFGQAAELFLRVASIIRSVPSLDTHAAGFELRQLGAFAQLHASLATYASAMQTLTKDPKLAAPARNLLERAAEEVAGASEFEPDLAEAHYQQARYLALLGDPEGTLASLHRAALLNRHYPLTQDIAKDFQLLKAEIFRLIARLESSARLSAETEISSLEFELRRVASMPPESAHAAPPGVLEQAKQLLGIAKAYFAKGQYVSFRNAIDITEALKQALREPEAEPERFEAVELDPGASSAPVIDVGAKGQSGGALVPVYTVNAARSGGPDAEGTRASGTTLLGAILQTTAALFQHAPRFAFLLLWFLAGVSTGAAAFFAGWDSVRQNFHVWGLGLLAWVGSGFLLSILRWRQQQRSYSSR